MLSELREVYPEYVSEDERHLPTALASVYARDTRPDKGFVFSLDEWDCISREAKDDIVAQFQNYGNDVLLVGINYDVKSKKHTCIIEKLQN